MKALFHAQAVLEAYTFISHMVQMKAHIKDSITEYSFLYIPHGSDERIYDKDKPKMLQHFISHMVQMKEFNTPQRHICPFRLYIPHGSDERQLSKIY